MAFIHSGNILEESAPTRMNLSNPTVKAMVREAIIELAAETHLEHNGADSAIVIERKKSRRKERNPKSPKTQSKSPKRTTEGSPRTESKSPKRTAEGSRRTESKSPKRKTQREVMRTRVEATKAKMEEDISNLLIDVAKKLDIGIPSSIILNREANQRYESESTLDASTAASTKSPPPGTEEFINNMVSKLQRHQKSICIQDSAVCNTQSTKVIGNDDSNFDAAFRPTDMRCLALVSHNGMKKTMKDFVKTYKNVLKHFRLTGTQSTMKMLAEVFAEDPDVVFGPSCKSGPLGGDAELVALMASGKLGGIVFFQDPMSSHPHQSDIDCLVRQAIVHNTIMAMTPSTAIVMMEVLRSALSGEGKPELIPSFFFTLQSPTVEAYMEAQKRVIRSRSSITSQQT